MKYLLGVLLFVSLSSAAQITINWQSGTSMPSFPRIDFGAFLIDSNYYVVGGIDSIENRTSQVWRYTITTDHWQQMNSFVGGPLSQHQCFAIGESGYLLTGGDSLNSYDCNNEFWKYDPLTDSWMQKANFPGGKRTDGTAFSFGSRGYFALGITCHVGLETKVWEYNSISDSWTLMPDTLPSLARYGCINSGYDTLVYFVGGTAENNNRLHDLWRYNLRDKSWDSLPPLPGVGRMFCMVYAFKDILLAGYGADDNATVLGDSHIYNYASHTWTSVIMNNFFNKTASSQNACFIYKRRAYYFGGARAAFSFYNSIRSFDATPYLPATNVGISDVAEDIHLRVYPNPISSHGILTISAPERGVVTFYDAIGQLVYTTPLASGINSISCEMLHTSGVVFYSAILSSGSSEKGKVVIVK